MNYFQILSCNQVVGTCCTDYGIVAVLDITRKIFDLIQMIVPIILILMATIQFVQLSINPELKDGFRRVLNKIVAAFIIFLLPVLMDAVLGLVPGDVQVSACWKAAKETAAIANNTTPRYIAADDEDDMPTVNNSSNDTVIVKPKLVEEKVNSGETNKNSNSNNKSSNNNSKSNSEYNPNQKVVDYAMQFIGGKYNYDGHWNGEKPYTPTNCVRFIKGAYKHFGLELSGASHTIVNDKHVHKISEKDIRAGDIVVYEVRHSAMIVGDGKKIIHDTSKDGVAVYKNYNYKKVKYFLRVEGLN